jgi:diguanylate cyclase (GGDEF)-like protein
MTGLIGTSRSPRGKFLIVAFIAMLSMQVFAVVVSGVSARRASIENAERSISAASEREIAAVMNFVKPAERIASETAELLDNEIVTVESDEIENYFFTRLASLEQISAAYVGLPDGSFVSVTRLGAGFNPDAPADAVVADAVFRSKRISIDADTGQRSVQLTYFDSDFNQLAVKTNTRDDYEPRQRPWYLSALETSGLVWNDPYPFSATGELGVTVSQTLRQGDDGDDVEAVVGVDVKLSGLSQFVDRQTTTAPEETFVVADGRVIAAPTNYELTMQRTADSALGLRTPAEFGLAFSDDTDNGVGRMRTENSNDLIARRSFPATSRTDWEIIVRAPESTYTSAARTQQRMTLIMSAGGALILAIAIFAMWRVTHPIGQLQEQAVSDPLTGLANRRQISAVGQAMLRDRRDGEQLAVLTLDLDEFKSLNDRYGHHIGDHALVVVADKLTALTRRGDLVGRLGGDEFVVALPVRDVAEGTEIAGRIMRRLTDALVRSVPQAELGVTGGLTLSHDDVFDFDELLIEADTALLQAKDEAKGMMMVAERVVSSSVRG